MRPQRNPPRASAGFNMFEASIAPSAAGADERVQLIDKQNDLTWADSISLRTAFKRSSYSPSILRTRQHRTEIETDQTLVTERLRDIAGYNSLRQSFDDRRFADAGFANQYRIVFRLVATAPESCADFTVPPMTGSSFPSRASSVRSRAYFANA